MEASELPRTPDDILSLSPNDFDSLLTALDRAVPRHPALLRFSPPALTEALVFGDSHGDWRATSELLERACSNDPPRAVIGLGDYIDRPPTDCPAGSVVNTLLLLCAVARSPDRTVLLVGNHELARSVGVSPHTLPEELDRVGGPTRERYGRLMGLLERGPLALTTPSGAYLAHAGFPTGRDLSTWAASPGARDEESILELTWAECTESRARRGATATWTGADLTRFLGENHLSVFLRGHDPDLTGRPLFQERCLTLHTCRLYERYGGVVMANLPLTGPLTSVGELRLTHLDAQGLKFPRTGFSTRPDAPV